MPANEHARQRQGQGDDPPRPRGGPGDPHQAPIQTETGEPGPPVIDLDKAVPAEDAREEEERATTVGGRGAVDEPDGR